MKNFFKTAAVITASLLLCSCSGQTINDSSVTETSGSISENTTEEAAAAYDMPVIYISSSDGKNNFASEPVNGYVSEQIASWTPGYIIPPEPYSSECTVSVCGADGEKLIDSAPAGVKVRGNWTTTYQKKPFRIEFEEKHNLLGLNDGNEFRTWLLLAEYKDASMLRNKSALEISREILAEDGLYASDAAFAEVYINDEYWGVYLVAEQQQANKNRVSVSKPEKDYQGTDIGYFLEFDGYYFLEDPLQQFHADYYDNAGLKPFNGDEESSRLIKCLPSGSADEKNDIGFTIKSNIYSQQQHDFIESFVCNAYRIMYEAAYNDSAYVFTDDYSDIVPSSDLTPEEAVEKAVDVRSLADMHIISELTCDADLYWSSFYLTADFGEGGNRKLTFQAPWDFDSSMGNKSRCPDGTGFYAASAIPDVNGSEYITVNPWLAVLIHEDWYQDVIRDKWTSLYDRGVFEKTADRISDDSEQYSSAFTRNNDRWGISSADEELFNELSDGAMKCRTQAESAGYLKEWLGKRVEFMNSYWHRK